MVNQRRYLVNLFLFELCSVGLLRVGDWWLFVSGPDGYF